MPLDLKSLEKAIATLERSLNVYHRAEIQGKEEYLETLQAGVIQAFEYSYELSWKMIRRWVEMNDSPLRVDGVPRIELFRVGAENRLLTDIEVWMGFHRARNETSHIYDQVVADRVFLKAKEFLPYAKTLLEQLKERNT